ncbi:MAG: glycosyltransferase family 39 protein [Chloroflexota bacterium]
MATSAERSSTSPALIQDTRALGVLLLFLLNLGLGAWLLNQSLVQAAGQPPLLPFVLIAIAAALLLATGDLTTAGEREYEYGEQERLPVHGDLSLIARFRRNRANWRLLLLVAAGALMVAALYRIPHLGLQDSHALVVAGWAGSIVCYTLALAPPAPGIRHRWRERWRTARKTHAVPLALLLGISVAAFLLRATFLETIPFTLSGDEASQGLEAVRVLQGEIRNPFTTGWLGVPTLSFYFNSLTIDLLGMTRTGLRLPWALLGTATVVVAFFLVRRLVGWPLALATSALLATYHYHIHFSRLGSNQIADPLFVALALWFLYRALDGGRESGRSRLGDWILVGGSAGIALYFYAGARFTPVIVAAILAYVLLRERRRFWPRHGRGVLAMIGAFLLVSAPMLQYAVRFPEDFNARLNQVGIIHSGWLEGELEAGRQLLPVLWDQFRRAALAFNFYPDRTVWYGLEQPLLDPLFGALFLVGVLYSTVAMWDRSEQRLAPMVAWWWGGMIAGGMLTESPPSSQRLITLSVPACFFIAVTLWQLARLVQRAIRGMPAQLVVGAGVLLFAVSSLQTYFLEYTPQRIYGGQHAELASEMAPLLNQMADTHRAYFVGAPWMYWGFGTIPYLAPQMEGQDITEPLTEPPPPDIVSPQRGAVFIVLPERRQELPLIQQAFPHGRLHEIHSRAPDGQLLGLLYTVPPG